MANDTLDVLEDLEGGSAIVNNVCVSNPNGYCGDGTRNGDEQCDGTNGLLSGEECIPA